jgi:hypothetical protein
MTVTSKAIKSKSEARVSLPGWGVKLTQRLGQRCKKPGIYPLTLIVNEDGERILVDGDGPPSRLGK